MPKLRKPLFSDGATGKMDEETVFSSRLGKSYRKRYAKPKQPNSESQKESKATFAWAIKTWQRELTDEDREAWRAFARKNKEVDPFTLTQIKPPAHALYLRFASQAKHAGYPAPKKPPQGPRPQPLSFTLTKKGRGVKIRWEVKSPPAPLLQRGEPPHPNPPPQRGEGEVVEFRMAVTQPWVKPWQTCFRIQSYVPMQIGEHFVSPLEPEKKYTFTARVLSPEGQASMVSWKDIVLKD
jgi:hypothetical protein